MCREERQRRNRVNLRPSRIGSESPTRTQIVRNRA